VLISCCWRCGGPLWQNYSIAHHQASQCDNTLSMNKKERALVKEGKSIQQLLADFGNLYKEVKPRLKTSKVMMKELFFVVGKHDAKEYNQFLPKTKEANIASGSLCHPLVFRRHWQQIAKVWKLKRRISYTQTLAEVCQQKD
jgi:hypothetical protein